MRALVLAGGKGTRLGELTRALPKPLLPIEGRPLLAYTLTWLAGNGIEDVALNLHFLGEQIRETVGTGSQHGVRIHYHLEPELVGTAGTVRDLGDWLSQEGDFLVVYGDLLIDQNLAPMVRAHRKTGAEATLLLHKREGSNSLVDMTADHRIMGFIERPDARQRGLIQQPWVNSGLQVLSPALLNWIPSSGASDLPRNVYAPNLNRRIFGFPLTGYRCAIDSPSRYRQACLAVRTGDYRCPPSRSVPK
jgi:mannose-1-phosphate guanylyltransferase/phosphomannomutase